MTAKELAALIDGRESGMELTAEEERQAEESGKHKEERNET